MTTAEMIVVIVLAVAAWILVLVMCYRLDVANLRIKHLREEVEDVSAVLKYTRETRDVFAKSNRELDEENHKLRRALQEAPDSSSSFGRPWCQADDEATAQNGTDVAGGSRDES